MPPYGRRFSSTDDMKDAFLAYLREKETPISVAEIPDFLLDFGFANDENVVAKRRAFMRKATSDPRFLFFGDTTARVVTFNEEIERTYHQREEASDILSILLKKTILNGLNMSMHIDEIADYTNGSGVDLLVNDNVVHVDPDNMVRWTKRGFIGYEVKSKRSSSLSLPERTWASLEEIITLFHQLNGEIEREGMEYHDFDAHPMVQSMLLKGTSLNKSEAIEVAIEHLRCTLQQFMHRT
jgi:hypothetical protein